MGKFVIVCYKPFSNKEKALLELVKNHLPVLLKEGLATDRPPYVMQAADGTVVEVFEWKSSKAIENAHKNPRILKMWEEFGKVCTFRSLSELPDCKELFPEFTPLRL